jgi:hypothetical protein
MYKDGHIFRKISREALSEDAVETRCTSCEAKIKKDEKRFVEIWLCDCAGNSKLFDEECEQSLIKQFCYPSCEEGAAAT